MGGPHEGKCNDMTFNRLSGALAALLLCVGMAQPSLAATKKPAAVVDARLCLETSLSFGNDTTTPCRGIVDGNDSEGAVDGLFGYDWDFAAKDETPGGYEGDFDFGLFADGGTSGSWGVTSWLGFETVLIVLKGGPTWSAFLIADTSLGGAQGGLFDTLSNRTGGGKPGPGLSHISLYTHGDPDLPPPPPPPPAVPVPAAGLLLLGALGVLGALRRRA